MLKGKTMGKFRKIVCRNSPAGITSWSPPSSTPSKREHLFFSLLQTSCQVDPGCKLHPTVQHAETFLNGNKATRSLEAAEGGQC